MSNQIYEIKDVEIREESIEVQFEDGLVGELPFEDLDISSPIQSIDKEHLNSSDGLEVKFTYKNGNEEVYPWDYFRYELDDDYKKKQKNRREKELRDLGKRVRRFRKARGLRQEDLANRAGIGRTTLSRLENGKQFPRFQTLMSLASAMDISFQNLMLEDNNLEKTILT